MQAIAVRWRNATVISSFSLGLLTIMLVHVYLLSLGVELNQNLTFWGPLLAASLLIVYAATTFEGKWVLGLIFCFAAALHMVIPLSQTPDYSVLEDAIYGYQSVSHTLATGHWDFGGGTGSARLYSFFPMLFVFAASWVGISSAPIFIVLDYAIPFVNLATLLTLRMLTNRLLRLPVRQTNLILIMYSLLPTIHSVESKFHYEAYAAIFLPLVILHLLKPKLSLSERTVAIIAILSIAFSHYFTSYMLMLSAVALFVAYIFVRGIDVNRDLIFLSIIAPLAWITSVAVTVFGKQLVTIQNVLGHLRDLNTIFAKVTTASVTSQPLSSYYPAPWLAQVASLRNGTILLFSVLAIISLSLKKGGRAGITFARRDMLTYLAGAWLFAVAFSVAGYYGVVWNQTALASEGGASSGARVVDFSFLYFAIFSGLGLSILLLKMNSKLPKLNGRLLKGLLCIFLVAVFVSSTVVQAYPRNAYDSSYVSTTYDEAWYPSTFGEPYYVGNWWNQFANHTYTNSRPVTGSRALRAFISGYGYQNWWEDNLNSPTVALNSTTRSYIVYYSLDLLQLQKPDHVHNMTLAPQLVSSQNSETNVIFSTGRIMIMYIPPPQT